MLQSAARSHRAGRRPFRAPPAAGRMSDRRRAVGREGGPPRGVDRDWFAEYVGHAYRCAVGRTLARLDARPPRVLKTDLWNETLGGARDVLGDLGANHMCWCVGIDLALDVCAAARAKIAGLPAVQADIRALPFRSGCFDAVLDLSTLDHVPEPDSASVTAGYVRVLRRGGVLLLVFWQRNLLVRLRLAAKRWLGRPEKADQHYLSRRAVLAGFGDELVTAEAFVAGSLLVAPQPLVGFFLRVLPPGAAAGLVRRVVSCEVSGPLQPLLRSIAGLYGVLARRGPRPGERP